jgi:hypothetical protein
MVSPFLLPSTADITLHLLQVRKVVLVVAVRPIQERVVFVVLSSGRASAKWWGAGKDEMRKRRRRRRREQGRVGGRE